MLDILCMSLFQVYADIASTKWAASITRHYLQPKGQLIDVHDAECRSVVMTV